MNCEGNCGRVLDDCEGYWTVNGPRGEELNFCSPACMDSWLNSELAVR
jgi:hypothetical protein